MIIGYAHVEDGAVTTHRDSFLLDSISTISVRRTYLFFCGLMALGLVGFAYAFSDLLYPGEILASGIAAFTLVLVGFFTAQLTLLSRDLKGTELSTAIWGTPGHLHKKRQEIVLERKRVSSRSTPGDQQS